MKKTLTTITIVALLTALCAAESMTPLGVTGNAAIGHEGNNWTITTTSKRTVINWSRFDVAEGGSVYFQQPSARSSVLNRVTGGSISHIDGLLSSNGRVYLLNPNGIVVGPDGVIRVAEFVGSTLGLSDAAFLAGKDMHFTGTSGAAIANYGTIDAIGGDVYLIAANVANKGAITAPSGSANLVAANDVLLTQDHQIFIRPGTGAALGTGVENSGSIDAAMARLLADGNMYALAINNSGAIRANGVASVDGRVMLVAQGGSIVNTGEIAAGNGQAGGEVRIIGENLTLRGQITAAGAHGGGLVETSAPTMDLTGLTLSAGPGGLWLLDPPLVIDATLAGTIAGQLTANTSVNYSGQTGSITVAADIIASPSLPGTYLWLGTSSTIAINANINVGIGRLYLQAANGVTQTAGTALTAGRLWLNGGGVFDLNQPGNDFGLVAVNVSNASNDSVVTIQDVNDITIGTIKGISGVSVLGGELHLLAPNGYVIATGLFGAGIVKEYHALGNVALTETSPLSGAYEIRVSNAAPYSKTPAQIAAFTNTTVGDLTGIGGANVDGSAVRLVFDPTLAGDLLGYGWNFRTAETFGVGSANDYAFTVIDPVGAGSSAQVLADVAQAASRGSAVQDTNEFSWETGWGTKTHPLNGVNPYELSFGTMNVDHPEVLSKLYLRNIFFQGHLIPPPPVETLVFDRIIDHVEDFPHLRPFVRVSQVGPELLAPVLDEMSTYFDVASQKTDHRYYYQSVGSIYQIPR
ncbi:MAG: filamentous hemagglutinin N-terminal domain-containing protein [Planctomycetota bacterium]|nr:filamentous hemagglutinin N-terminal domain-containing protein [Planctomycetota bacterium]